MRCMSFLKHAPLCTVAVHYIVLIKEAWDGSTITAIYCVSIITDNGVPLYSVYQS